MKTDTDTTTKKASDDLAVGCDDLLAFGIVMEENGIRKCAVVFTKDECTARQLCLNVAGEIIRSQRTPHYDFYRVSHSPGVFYDPKKAFRC